MKKLLLILLAIVTIISNVVVAESVILSHEVKIAKIDKVGAIAELGLIGIDEILNDEQQYTHEFYTYDSLSVSKREFWWLVYIVFTESNTESDSSQRKTVYTILNRVASDKFDNDIISVIKAPSQFDGYKLPTWGRWTEANVKNVYEALVKWNIGQLPSEYYEIYLFNDPTKVSSGYVDRYRLRKIVEDGVHTFYGYKED